MSSGLKNTTKYNTFKKYNKTDELNKMRNVYDLYGYDKQSYYNEVYKDIIDKDAKSKNKMLRESLKNMRKNYFINYLTNKKNNDEFNNTISDNNTDLTDIIVVK